MKTPEEIKKGLGEAIAETSWVVDDGDAHDLRDACDKARTSMADALALIQQLEAQNAELMSLLKQNAKSGSCIGCKHFDDTPEGLHKCEELDFDCEHCELPCKCCSCHDGSNYEWQGVTNNSLSQP